MHEALCRSSGTTLDSVHAEDGPPITQRTSGLIVCASCREREHGVRCPIVLLDRCCGATHVYLKGGATGGPTARFVMCSPDSDADEVICLWQYRHGPRCEIL